MPGRLQEPTYNHIQVKELHPTFGAEVSGIDFSQGVEEHIFQEILQAISKVRNTLSAISEARLTLPVRCLRLSLRHLQ